MWLRVSEVFVNFYATQTEGPNGLSFDKQATSGRVAERET